MNIENIEPAIKAMMMPKDTNPHGIIFGGTILSYIDQAGAIVSREYAMEFVQKQAQTNAQKIIMMKTASEVKFVTVAVDAVEFHEPVFVGDIIKLYGQVVKTGKSSITVKVTVMADRFSDLTQTIKVTESTLVYVAIDKNSNLPMQIFCMEKT